MPAIAGCCPESRPPPAIGESGFIPRWDGAIPRMARRGVHGTLNRVKTATLEAIMSPDVLTSIRELAARTCDGLHVRLLWSAAERRTWVSIIDLKGDDTVTVAVSEGQSPLDVFNHPFAYAG